MLSSISRDRVTPALRPLMEPNAANVMNNAPKTINAPSRSTIAYTSTFTMRLIMNAAMPSSTHATAIRAYPSMLEKSGMR